MKTIASFSKPEEAHLFRLRLEAAEIPAFVLDENVVSLDWLLSNAIGGVRVQVADCDVDRAREFLAEDKPHAPPDAVDVTCPACGSVETAPVEWPRRVAFLSMLLFRIPLLLVRHRWRCAACGHAFRSQPTLPKPSRPTS